MNVGLGIGAPVGDGVAVLVETTAVSAGDGAGGIVVGVGEGARARAGTVGVGRGSDMPTRTMKSEMPAPMSVFSLRRTTDMRARRITSDAMNPQPPHPRPGLRELR